MVLPSAQRNDSDISAGRRGPAVPGVPRRPLRARLEVSDDDPMRWKSACGNEGGCFRSCFRHVDQATKSGV